MTTQLTEDARRSAILDAAATLIAERGYHSVRISDIAKVVGTSTGAVHYYFPGKSDVLTAALRHAIDNAFDRQSRELQAIDDAHQRLLRLIDMQLPRLGPVRDEWSIWLNSGRKRHCGLNSARSTTPTTPGGTTPWSGSSSADNAREFSARRRPGNHRPTTHRAHRRRRDPGVDWRTKYDGRCYEGTSRAVRPRLTRQTADVVTHARRQPPWS